MNKRVVVTGMGLVTPFGVGVEKNWNEFVLEKSCIKPLTKIDTSTLRVKVGGEISDINYTDLLKNNRCHKFDETVLLSMLASQEAIGHAQLSEKNCQETGLILGTCFGTIKTKEETFYQFAKDELGIYSLIFLKGMDNAAANEVAIRHQLKRINQTVFTACSSSLMAIGNAYRCIKNGYEKRILAGGVDVAITQSIIKAWEKLHVISLGSDVNKVSQPFSKFRDGLSMSEGAGFLVLEDYDEALKRNVDILGEIGGFGTNCDATHMTSPDIDSQSRAIKEALDDAGVLASQVQYINAHGTATQLNDRVETQVIKKVFGDYAYQIPISASKSQLGHTMGACGAIETILTFLMMKHNVVLPTLHFEKGDLECDLDYVPNSVRAVNPLNIAIKHSFGFGGSNAVIVLKRV